MTFDPDTALACAQTIRALYTHAIAPNIACAATDTQVLVERISGRAALPRCPAEQQLRPTDSLRPGSSARAASGSSSQREDDHQLFAVHFPGTASWRDALTDAKIRKETSGAGRVHRGFKAAARSVYSDIVRALPPGCRVILSGHSLGGAVATLVADWLKGCGYEIQAVYTFGSPRVANGPWQRCYNRLLSDRTFRIVNAGDPVPHVPWMLGTYRHVNSLVYLDRSGGMETSCVKAAALELAEKLSPVQTETSEFVSARAHYLTRYIAQLERLNRHN